MLREFKPFHGLWLVCAISVFFNLSCSDDSPGGNLPDDECDAQCELEKLEKLCGNGILDGDLGEPCDAVGGAAKFKGDLDCTDYIEQGIGSLKCSASCKIDASDCHKKDVIDPECKDGQSSCNVENIGGKSTNVLVYCSNGKWAREICDGACDDTSCIDPQDPKCKAGQSNCKIVEIDGKLTNTLITCVEEKWETTVCAGSCDGISCTECLEDDLVCNPPVCTEENEIACFDGCCNKTESFCDFDGIGACCAYDNVCGKHCCGEGTVCENAVCRKTCENTRCVGVDNVEFCCNAGETCISNQCFTAKVSCVDNYACENDQYCDALLGQCLPQPKTVPACLRTPKGGEIKPTLLWQWGLDAEVDCPLNLQVMSTPMVADLDKDGFPEVIFNTFQSSDHSNGVIRVVDGKTGKTKFTIFGDESKGRKCNLTVGGSQVSIGDLDGDGFPDIVTCAPVNRETGLASNDLIAFKHDGTFLWQSGRTLSGKEINRYCGQSGPGIVDFDGDGTPEVYVSYTVVNGQTGAIKWQQPCELNQETGDAVYYHNGCEYSVAADLDDDGRPELVGGNVAWKSDGTLFYRADPPFADGYPAVADVNLDGKPNVVVVDFHEHSVRLLDNTGKVLWTADTNKDIAAAGVTPGGGPANIANIDDDPYPEITMAGGYAYQAFKHDGTRKWVKRTKDFSSKKTGASIFDFDGDGQAEAVYADEEWLRVYDGATGATRFCIPNTSATHWEYPVIADVNADGSAEIVVCSNNYSTKVTNNALAIDNGRDECVQKIIGPDPANPTLPANDPILKGTAGVRVFAAPNKDWVSTRKIWNQHAYSITNVSNDGTIPRNVRPNWSVNNHNNFRLNQEPGATNLPDLTVQNISSSTFLCKDNVDLFFEIRNRGWAAADKGIPVTISVINAENVVTQIAALTTSRPILPGEAVPMSFSYVKENAQIEALSFIVTVGDQVIALECDTTNNNNSYDYSCQKPIN